MNSLATHTPRSARRTVIFTLVGVAASVGGVLAAMALALSPTVAQATTGLEPGVHIDPGSPAAKEYVIPLAQARQTGNAGSSSDGSSAALFGAGIGPRGGGGSSSSSSRSGSRGSGAAKAKGQSPASVPSKTAATNGQESLPSSLLASSSRVSGSGDGSILALVGGGVLILILGALGGTVLRRARHPTTSG